MSTHQTKDQLVEVWAVLEAITVSLDRLGQYELQTNAAAAREALSGYFDPDLFQRIARARRSVVDVLETLDPHIHDHLEALAADEHAIGYWQGSKRE